MTSAASSSRPDEQPAPVAAGLRAVDADDRRLVALLTGPVIGTDANGYRLHLTSQQAFVLAEALRAGGVGFLSDAVADAERRGAVCALREAAVEHEQELVCCDIYERLHAKPVEEWTVEEHRERHQHDICYWGAACAEGDRARALALDPDGSDGAAASLGGGRHG